MSMSGLDKSRAQSVAFQIFVLIRNNTKLWSREQKLYLLQLLLDPIRFILESQ